MFLMSRSSSSNTKGGFRLIVDRLIYTDRGQIIASVLIGFAIALLFRKVCNDRNCKVILAPPLEHVQKTVFELEGDCYRYTPVPTKCPDDEKNASIVPSE